jgi:hypothetical protein
MATSVANDPLEVRSVGRTAVRLVALESYPPAFLTPRAALLAHMPPSTTKVPAAATRTTVRTSARPSNCGQQAKPTSTSHLQRQGTKATALRQPPARGQNPSTAHPRASRPKLNEQKPTNPTDRASARQRTEAGAVRQPMSTPHLRASGPNPVGASLFFRRRHKPQRPLTSVSQEPYRPRTLNCPEFGGGSAAWNHAARVTASW